MKKLFLVMAIVMIVPTIFLFAGCGKEKSEELTNYSLNLSFDDESMTLSGQETVEYFNSSDNAFSQLYFHLYPNAFRQDATFKPYNLANGSSCFPNGTSYGNITVSDVMQSGENLQFEIAGVDCNILIVTLKDQLYPDERAVLDINFCVKLANINHRLGYGNNAINFGNFYPIACVYENGTGFATSPYCSNGDPFYSDIANYNVKITYPSAYQIACSGVEVDTLESLGKKVTYAQGLKIRDFCFILGKNFRTESLKVGDTTINYFSYYDQAPSESLKIAADALETFNETFGTYPYPVLNVVETNFNTGGMEYPNLVMISDKLGSQQEYGYVIVHEIAHQWWYGVVGNDEYNHAWQDEGLTEYSTLLFYEKNEKYGQSYENLVKNAEAVYKHFEEFYRQHSENFSGVMDRPLDQFNYEPEYVNCVYTKSVLMFDAMREAVGQRKFEKALKQYYKNFAYKNATPADMIASFSNSTGYPLEGFFNSWLSDQVVMK